MSGVQALLRRRGVLQRLSPVLSDLEAMLPDVPSLAARRVLPTETPPEGVEQGQVALLTGCVTPELLPQVNRATVRVLAANGYRVMAPSTQRCCGALHAHAGELAAAQRLARQNIAAFEATRAEWVVVNAAGCGAMMKAYDHLLADDAAFGARARALSRRVRDVTEFLATAPLRRPLQPLSWRVAYDDPCHLLHGQQIREQPRDLLRQVPGLHLIDIPESDWCCGSAGIYNLVHTETANALMARKMDHIASVRPHLVVTGNPGCILQLRRGVAQHQLGIEVCHPVEVLARAYTRPTPAGCGVP
jgi:glycolate oxidase iron-sulfur subunit